MTTTTTTTISNMSIKVINFDDDSESSRRLVEMFPNVMRCGIFGPSGCGKTNVLMTILLHHEPVSSIYLCSRTAFQDKYLNLEKLVDSYNVSNRKKMKFVKCTPATLLLPEKVDEHSSVIFDDVLAEGQDQIAKFFMRGRHRKISCFYLSQSYTKIPKKSGIRENFNFLVIFRQDNVNLRQLYNEYISDLTFDQFRSLCNKCWKLPYGFLTVDTEKCRYKQKFDHTLQTNQEEASHSSTSKT